MSRYDRSIVASGHQFVSEAAGEILDAGGNAFDAVVAAGFASAVAEPALTSLGGGGFIVGHSEKTGQDMFFDFFVDTPGRGRENDIFDPDFFGITVDFSGSSQDFHIGLGSVAVPGTLKGLLHIHKRLGRMNLADVIGPAKEIALQHRLNEHRAHFLKLLYPIMTLTDRGRGIYEPGGQYLVAGDNLKNPEMAEFLGQLSAEGAESFYFGDIAHQIDQEMKDSGGLLTAKDLAAYEVRERRPLAIQYRDSLFLTVPEPSMGGTLVGLSLSLLAAQPKKEYDWGSGEHLLNTVGLMKEVEKLREKGVTSPGVLQQYLQNQTVLEESTQRIRLFSRGTTHVSVADNRGNCASMTCSNGEGSGYFAPGTGVMLNNMMGEDDLHPDGFHSSEPGERVFSMMSPSLLLKEGHVQLVIGSGGSKRIRTAVSQVLNQVVDFSRPLQQAVDAPRLYLDGDCLQLEPGFSEMAVTAVKSKLPVNLWPQKDVYFGGVHAVIPGAEGAADPRRGGSVVTVYHNENGQ
ncbi:MAG: gamma-glutamyltransferase [Desulforhopalus sp.]|nr:gamma-glutamyltransferase [Desulforhopalus sp.]